jgi:hypothetical protein
MISFLFYTFISLLSFIGGIVLSGQLLGFSGLYYRWSVVVLAALLAILFFIILKRTSKTFLCKFLQAENEGPSHLGIEIIGYLAGFALCFVILIIPTLFWPGTNITHSLTPDASLYHLPKAIELLTSHSTWDFTIAYGEYPWGYESLIAFSFIFSKTGAFIGPMHALIILFFTLSLFLLSTRFSKLPRGLLFFIVSLVVCSYDIFRWLDSNPWWIFRVLAFTIGKNDLFLAASILCMLIFSPIGPRDSFTKFNIFGMGLSSAIVLSIKPNGVLIVICVWSFLLIQQLILRRAKQELGVHWKSIAFSFLMILLGSLWVIRNFIQQGKLFSENAMAINQWSILNNLANPFFYKHLDFPIKSLLIIAVLLVLATIISKEIHWNILCLYFILFLSFIATPATAFFGSVNVPAQIDYRFGAHLLAFELLVILLLLEPVSRWIFRHKSIALDAAIVAVVLLGGIWGCLQNKNYLSIRENNSRVLLDSFKKPVGVDGYYSAYDYVQKNVNRSVVYVENGYPFYVLVPNLTNTITRSRPADYYVIFKTSNASSKGYPDQLDTDQWKAKYKLVYEDGEGRVYKRVSGIIK